MECVPTPLATYITEILSIPTIGIGAGNGCDGQVLVYQDMLRYLSSKNISRRVEKDIQDDILAMASGKSGARAAGG